MLVDPMVGLTEKDLERIKQFADTPRYDRDPDQLRPGTSDDGREEGENRTVPDE